MSEFECILVTKTDSQVDINKKLAAFRDVDNNGELQNDTPQLMSATSSAVSIGLTITEAMAVAFVEPDVRLATMAQGWARHWRQGNKNRIVYSLLYIAADNEVEEKIMAVNQLRKKIGGAVKRKAADKRD